MKDLIELSKKKFMETNEYFELFLTEINLTKANKRVTDTLFFIILKHLTKA